MLWTMSMTAESVLPALRRVALFRRLPDVELEALARQVVRRRFGRNQLIFSQGDRGDGLYIVAQGHVTITRENWDGGELILGVNEPGEYFGELALFDDEPRVASVTAIEGCETFFLSRDAFRQFLRAHPDAVFTCLQVIVRQFRRLTELADEIALLDLRSRLARRLLRLADQGMVGTPDGAPASFRITQQQLANMMGATRESVNKRLHALADEGMVELTRGEIMILDRERLEECAEGFA